MAAPKKKSKEEVKYAIWELMQRTGMCREYHQILYSRYNCWDRSIKILIGVLSIASLCLAIFAMAGLNYSSSSVAVAGAAVFVASVLNIVPIDRWCFNHKNYYQKWSELHREVEQFSMTIFGVTLEREFYVKTDFSEEGLTPQQHAAFSRLSDRLTVIEVSEPRRSRDESLIDLCTENQYQRMWGVRTRVEIEEVIKKLKAKHSVGINKETLSH